ncbi:plasmid mobilization relaxosome protein MobC [Vibrio parahaemolyticus]|nr:plasmid mobilization relaxosome protein MobC [Vibrio parahaemolyticus]
MEKRTKIIKIRATEDEYQCLLKRCDRPELAPWMRDVCLNQHELTRAKIPTVDPALLRQIAAVGNNVNQIARVVNTNKHDPLVVLNAVARLTSIESKLDMILNSQRAAKHDS